MYRLSQNQEYLNQQNFSLLPCDPDYDHTEGWRQTLFTLIQKFFSGTSGKISDILHISQENSLMSDSTQTDYLPAENLVMHLVKYLKFDIENEDEIVKYVAKYPEIYDIFLYACLLTYEKFMDDNISIKVDGEITSKYSSIIINVRQNEYSNDIIEQMDLICEEYEPFLPQEKGYILLTTDFAPINSS